MTPLKVCPAPKPKHAHSGTLCCTARMRERELQCVGRRLLLLGICLLSLWGQLSLASTHRSHIGREIDQRRPLMVQCGDGWCGTKVHLSLWPMRSESVGHGNLSPNLWLDQNVHPGVCSKIQRWREKQAR
ncbi:hypothetical protein E1301_Tti004858 [Triplophysa tibetana]|uniref:Uncharacterized protein n=1 Tax=Triplophysa tibetana TaxID=1572043 RepID=A0A5A9NUF8_9TELE|nr:hypothetical protein E1301_Tti004858 [Triplophysa tibetana]